MKKFADMWQPEWAGMILTIIASISFSVIFGWLAGVICFIGGALGGVSISLEHRDGKPPKLTVVR